MVLEATTDPSSSSDFTSESPPSDFDSDADPNRVEASYKFDISRLPQANVISRSFLGRNEARLHGLIALNVSAAAQHLHRMPTQDEFNALAYHTAKAQAIASYGGPSGVIGGALQCYYTRENYKFPFVKPSEGFNPNAFTLGGRTWLTGERARYFWHVLRFSAYGACGGWFAGICCAAYAASVMAVGELTDPRLKALQEAIKRETRATLEKRGVGQSQPKKVGVTEQGDTSAGELWKRHRTTVGANDTQVDDASLSAGQQETKFAQSMAVEERLYRKDTGRGEMGGMGGAGGSQAAVVTSPPPANQSAWGRAAARAKTNTPDSKPNLAGGFYDSYDDASPTAMDTPSTSSTDSASGGSAWERIRREAGTEPSSRSRRGRGAQQQSSQDGDTGGMDDRERAQTEFDAQLERERQGSSFGGSNRGREW